MMKKIFISAFCILLLVINPTYGQTKLSFPHVQEMSPNAASIAQYQDCPVSYYTGSAQISIPLYEIDIDGIKIPLSLNYHSSGIKVAEESSWVGLGWSLDIGGRITRTIKNVDDFLDGNNDPEHPYFQKGYYNAPEIVDVHTNNGSGSIICHPNTYEYVNDNPTVSDGSVLGYFTLRQKYDSQPDIFYYNLPTISGKFIFDKNKNAVLFDKSQNVVVQVGYDRVTNDAYFILKDAQGNRYIFKDAEKTKSYRQKKSLNENGTTLNCLYDNNTSNFIEWKEGCYDALTDGPEAIPGPANPYEFISCWCLSEIITNRNRSIRFLYDVEDQYLPTQESCEIASKVVNWVPVQEHDAYKSYYQSKTVNRALRLRKIEYDFGYVNFSCSNRKDIKTSASDRSKKLDCISIYNKSSHLIKRFDFDYGYFNPDYEGTEYEHVFLRLKLNRVTDSTIDRPYEFSYEEEHSLPAKNSKNTDYWGYYNGRNYGNTYCVGVFSNNRKYSGVKKDSNPEYMTTYMLNSITYPTGGTEYFEYEPHKIQTYFYYRTNDDEGNPSDLPPGSPSYNSREIVYLNNYNKAFISDWAYENYPQDTTIQLNIYGRTALSISCTLDNVSGVRDNSFNYGDYLGTLYNVDSPQNLIHIYNEYPLVYESNGTNGGVGSEITLNTKLYMLDAGTYVFSTGYLPKEVHAEWKLVIDKQYSPGTYNTGRDMIPPFEYGGGLRIKSIRTAYKTRNFTYSEGKMLTEPVLFYLAKRNINGELWPCLIQTSESSSSLSTFNNGYTVGYGCVTETIEDDECPTYTKYYYSNDSECELVDDNFADGPVNIVYTNGLIQKKEVWGDDNLLLKNEYEYDSTSSQRLKAIYDRSLHYYDDEWLSFSYVVEWPKMVRDTETVIDESGVEKVLDRVIRYNNHDLISEENTNDGESQYKSLIYYPFDFASTERVYAEMVDSNAVGIPIEIVQIKDGYVCTANRALYMKEHGMYLPSEHNEITNGSHIDATTFRAKYYQKESFDQYDEYGNICQYSNSDGKLYTYLWGYNYQYPIVEVENATYSQVVDCLGGQNAVNRFLSIDTPTDAEVMNFLNPLANHSLPNTLVKVYTYMPLIGMTSKTDVNDVTTYYLYDSKNRLYKINDTNNNTVKEFKYHWK